MGSKMISIDTLPAITKIVTDAEAAIHELTGKRVSLRMHVYRDESTMLDVLQERLCELTEVSWRDIASKKRHRDISLARHLYCYCARVYLGMSLPKIAETINRDHTSVIHGVRNCRQWLTTDLWLKQTETTIKKELYRA